MLFSKKFHSQILTSLSFYNLRIDGQISSTNIGTWEINTKGFGSKILKRFGWKEGQPIGKNSLGLVLPLYCEENGQFDGKSVRIIIPYGTVVTPLEPKKEMKLPSG